MAVPLVDTSADLIIDTKIDQKIDPKVEIKNSLLQKFSDLMQGVDPNHKVAFINSKIKTFPKCVKERAIVEGDSYLKEFLATLSTDELNDLFNSITRTILRNPQAMENKKTADTVNFLVSGAQPKSTHTVVQEAYDAIGNIFSQTARAEENKQYEEANKKYPDRKLEEREYNLCGNPYGQILRENLPHLEIDAISYAKFNRAIRKALIKYQNGDITLLDLQLRLRYALSQLAISLEQRGFIAASMQVRRQVFGEAYAGDGLAGVFADQNKVDPKKVRPTVTADIKARADSYLAKLKESIADIGKFLGLEAKPGMGNIAANDINKQVANFIGELEDFPTDEEARRKFLNRVANVRMAYFNLDLDKQAREGIDDDDLFADLPYNYEDLAFAFENHLNKLSQRINPDAEKSYFPKPK
jgi:hypothetical protein